MPSIMECARSRKFPRPGQVFTTAEVFALDLRDSPCFDVPIGPCLHVVQTSHCLDEALLALPAWKDATWRFVRETSEWIPIFRLERGDVPAMVDHEPERNGFRPSDLWVTPKGLPRTQWELSL